MTSTSGHSGRAPVMKAIRAALASVRHRAKVLLAMAWRRMMFRTTVIVLTGSVGKTTAKECLAGILATHGRTLKTPENQNGIHGVTDTLFRVRPWHKFVVLEVGTERPGGINSVARVAKPDVAIILAVARTHIRSFPTLEDTALEKSALLKHVSPKGVAILNADDERVRAMAGKSPAPVRLFGSTEDCDYAAADVSSAWPDSLEFTFRSTRFDQPVRTRLIGTQWLSSALAAMAAAESCGVPVEKAAAAIATVPPFAARMQPVRLPNGAVVIRDEETGSPDTVAAMFKVMRESRAQRRVLVFSEISDSDVRTRVRLREVGREAAELSDLAVFVGEHGRHGIRGALEAGMDPEHCHHIPELDAAATFLKAELQDGDLVFIKGRTTDHLSRIVFAQFGRIGCWRKECRLRPVCDFCPELKPEFNLKAVLAPGPRDDE